MKNQTITKLTTTIFLILTAIVGAAQIARAVCADPANRFARAVSRDNQSVF